MISASVFIAGLTVGLIWAGSVFAAVVWFYFARGHREQFFEDTYEYRPASHRDNVVAFPRR